MSILPLIAGSRPCMRVSSSSKVTRGSNSIHRIDTPGTTIHRALLLQAQAVAQKPQRVLRANFKAQAAATADKVAQPTYASNNGAGTKVMIIGRCFRAYVKFTTISR